MRRRSPELVAAPSASSAAALAVAGLMCCVCVCVVGCAVDRGSCLRAWRVGGLGQARALDDWAVCCRDDIAFPLVASIALGSYGPLL